MKRSSTSPWIMEHPSDSSMCSRTEGTKRAFASSRRLRYHMLVEVPGLTFYLSRYKV